MAVSSCLFGSLEDGTRVMSYTITNSLGSSVTLIEYGARIQSIVVPDVDGKMGDVVLGYDNLSDYLSNDLKMGAIIGRVACRIAKGEFISHGKNYQLSLNDGSNTQHGGFSGFDRKVWSGKPVNDNSVLMSLVSGDGDEGFPGLLIVNVLYTFDDSNCLTLEYRATTSEDTPCSLTNHVYFNLSDSKNDTILDHELKLISDYFCENGTDPILTGAIIPVANTPLDFTDFKKIGAEISSDFEQLKRSGGYNSTFVLNKKERDSLELAAVLKNNSSRRKLEVYTTSPGLLLFTSNNTPPHFGKNGNQYGRYSGITMETMYFGNALACTWFPSPVLKKEQAYCQRTKFCFSTF